MWKTLQTLYVAMALATGAMLGQGPPLPSFDVATIRPAPPITAIAAQIQAGKVHVGMTIDAARVDIGFLSVADIIPIAYRVKPYQVKGPDAMRADRWDVVATIPEGTSKDLVPEMLQALLKERFKLALHRESKELPVYALVVGKGGPKLKDSPPDVDAPPAEDKKTDDSKSGPVLSTPQGQIKMSTDNRSMTIAGGPNGPMRVTMPQGPGGVMHMEMSKMSMKSLAELLTPMLDKPVVDMTDLKGNYQVALDLPMAELMNMARAAAASSGMGAMLPPGPPGAGPADAASDPSGGSMVQAVQQLGLRLEPRKSTVDMIVVDHVEKTPTDN